MKTCTSISGGQTSAYLAANYPTNFNVFSLVRTSDKSCIFPDKKLRQFVSDKIGKEFIGTLESDEIIYTIIELEQFIGSNIDWVSGATFDEVNKRGDKTYVPNVTMRFCTIEMKLKPIFQWWQNNCLIQENEPIEMRIGFRANEMRRAKNMYDRVNEDGLLEMKGIIGKHSNGNNKWKNFAWQKPSFPLIDNNIYKDKIVEFWKDKPVTFAKFNNCVGCFHRNPIMLKHMSDIQPTKFQWFVEQEKKSLVDYTGRSWLMGATYEQIKNHKSQLDLFDEDFEDCDSGHCGL